MKAIEPIWMEKPETAGRVRGRIEAILDWAAARGYRQGENPARWRCHLENLLPKKSKVRRVEHHAALPYAEIAAFMAELRRQEGVAARALEFAILTAARTGEVIGAKWGEIDLDERLWTLPAEHMKAAKEQCRGPVVTTLRRIGPIFRRRGPTVDGQGLSQRQVHSAPDPPQRDYRFVLRSTDLAKTPSDTMLSAHRLCSVAPCLGIQPRSRPDHGPTTTTR
jgi:integrase